MWWICHSICGPVSAKSRLWVKVVTLRKAAFYKKIDLRQGIYFILILTSKAKLKGRRDRLKWSKRFRDSRSCFSCEESPMAPHWGFVAACTAWPRVFFIEDIDVQSSSSSTSDDEFYLTEQPPLVTMPMTAMTKRTLTHLTQLIVVRHH